MQENADVVPRDADSRHTSSFSFFKEDRSQDGAVAPRQGFEHLADYPACVFGNYATQGIWFAGNETICGLIIEGLHSTRRAKMLQTARDCKWS